MATFVIGDIHGGYKALLQCLERSNFNKEEDILISLGDIADGWSEVPECVEELLSIRNLIPIQGNHDDWALKWLRTGVANPNWLNQGGQATYDAYTIRHPDLMIKHEQEFFNKQINFYHDKENNRAYIHAGYRSEDGVGNDMKMTYLWDRDFWHIALSGAATLRGGHSMDNRMPRTLRPHNEIFIGHTTTLNWGTDNPMNACNVWNLDTGGGFGGKLTIMNVDTKEYWQSDLVRELYPEEKGR